MNGLLGLGVMSIYFVNWNDQREERNYFWLILVLTPSTMRTLYITWCSIIPSRTHQILKNAYIYRSMKCKQELAETRELTI